MKKAALLLIVAATISCCKKGTKDYSVEKNSLIDKWELRKSDGGIAGTIIYPPGNGSVIEFKSDDTYTLYYKDTVIQSGIYDLQSTPEKDQYKLTFHTDGLYKAENITLKGDTLVSLATSPCCDMPNITYVRIN